MMLATVEEYPNAVLLMESARDFLKPNGMRALSRYRSLLRRNRE